MRGDAFGNAGILLAKSIFGDLHRLAEDILQTQSARPIAFGCGRLEDRPTMGQMGMC